MAKNNYVDTVATLCYFLQPLEAKCDPLIFGLVQTTIIELSKFHDIGFQLKQKR